MNEVNSRFVRRHSQSCQEHNTQYKRLKLVGNLLKNALVN